MTVEEAVIQAFARLAEFGHSVPGARSVLYRRLGVRQQQLFVRAARLNPEYYGICATGDLDAGALDLADLVDPIEAADTISKIEVADAGTSTAVAVGDEINVVPISDVEAEDAPRMTLRNRILRGVGSDLDDVLKLKVHYSRIPLPIAPTDADLPLELEEPHVELLVVDLTRWMVRKLTKLAESERKVALSDLDAEESELLDAYDGHVIEYSGVTRARFPVPPRQVQTENDS